MPKYNEIKLKLKIGDLISVKFNFKDIYNRGMLDTCSVMIITGQHDIFSNTVVDSLKGICKGEMLDFNTDSELEREFSVGIKDEAEGNYIDFDTFMDIVKIPSVTGKWFCSIDYKMLTKRQRERFKRYIKNPSNNGVLAVTIKEYVDYREFLKDKVIRAHNNSHLIQLQFPNRGTLKEIVKDMASQRNVKLPEKAIELFIMRMSNNYEDYENVLDTICKNRENSSMSYKEFSEAMRGIENYVLDDFIEQLFKVIKTRKIATNRKIYRMVDGLVQDIGAKNLVYKMRFKIDDLLNMRVLINDGVIPINIRFSVKEAKERIGEGSKLYNMNDYAFRRLAELASKASLKDLIYIKMILNNVDSKWNDAEYERVIHSVVHRSIFSSSRLANDIGISNIIDEQLYSINTAFMQDYTEEDIL